MNHEMRLYSEPFEHIKSGTKTIETRLNDEKRQKIRVGDMITFQRIESEGETLTVEVLELLPFKTFRELYESFPFEDFGCPGRSMEQMLDGIYKIYTPEKEREFGALGIRIKLLDVTEGFLKSRFDFSRYDKEFWLALDKLAEETVIIIDRPKGSSHPRYPEIVYPVSYGYLKGTMSMDGQGIDVWKGSIENPVIDTIICTVDLLKRDSEIKLLIGCTDEEKELIYRFHNEGIYMKGILFERDT